MGLNEKGDKLMIQKDELESKIKDLDDYIRFVSNKKKKILIVFC